MNDAAHPGSPEDDASIENLGNVDHTSLDMAMLSNMMAPKAVTIKVPQFLPFAVDIWRRQCDACFNLHNIKDETTKYYQVLANLKPDTLKKITAYISAPRAGHEYSGLLAALEFAFTKADGQRFDELMEAHLGDMSASELYFHLRRLWLDPDPDNSKVLKHIFMRKLPLSVAVSLRSVPQGNLTEYLQIADAMLDQHHQRHAMAREVQALPMNEMDTCVSDKVYPKPEYQSFSQKGQKRRTEIFSDGLCYYHHTFGQKAHRCISGCKEYVSKKSINAVDPCHIDLPMSWNQHKAVKLQQKVNGRHIIVDTGSTFSLVPARFHELKRKPNNSLFKGAQGACIPVYGMRTLPVDIGTGRIFNHKFFIAGVEDPLLGMDFLLEHRLLVDPVNGKLIDVDTYQTTPVNSVLVQKVQAVKELPGKLAWLWKEFPSLTDASIDKFSNKPLHAIEHDIILKPGSQPTKARARRLFGDKLKAAKDEIDSMLQLGIIQRSSSEWASPLHVVPKGEGAFRPCGDFRHLNASTIPDQYPLPHVQDFSRNLNGSKVFSKIDLVRAFHQIPLTKEAVPKTAIITPFGLFEFLRMPFGLCNAAQAFQRFMDCITRGLEGVHVYIDDILVVGRNDEEHERRLRQLLARLTKNGLIVNPAKSVLGASEVNFLGFTVNENGVQPMQKKIDAIRNFPEPQKFSQLSEFLGMVNFYHRFIPKCSDIARPLYDLLKLNKNKVNSTKPIKIELWQKEQQDAFLDLKQQLQRVSSLSYPLHDVETRLVTDASETAAGAVLEQLIDGCWKPIGFFSKRFHGSEMSYSTYDRELLAMKLSIQHFRHVIEGIPGNLFHILTDHKPLTTGRNFEASCSNKTQLDRVTRTWQFIAEISTDIRHVSGSDNKVADALSRNAVNRTIMHDLIPMIERAQEEANMRPDSTNDQWPDHWKVQLHHGCRLTVDTRGPVPRPVIPESIQKAIFDSFHNMAHLGVKATRKAISQSYVWPNLSKDVGRWVNACSNCQKSKITRHNSTYYQSFAKPSGKFQVVHVDIVGPLPSCQEFSYILTAVDRFSRWPAAVPLKGITSKECAEAFLQGWIQNYGTPLTIITDQGRQFTSLLWQELCRMLGTTHSTTTAYHPQSNGMVERFHRQLKASLMSLSDKNNNWINDLPLVMLGIRTSVKEDLHLSTAQMVFGECLRLPHSFFPDMTHEESKELYTADLQKRMGDLDFISPDWHGNFGKDLPLKGLQDCTHVFVYESAIKTSLQRPYRGPYRVISRGDKSFTIELREGVHDVVSTDRLKPAFTIG